MRAFSRPLSNGRLLHTPGTSIFAVFLKNILKSSIKRTKILRSELSVKEAKDFI